MENVTEGWGSWDVLQQFLPQGWAEQAHASGALRRARKTRKAAIDGPGRGLDRLVVALANVLQNAARI